MNKKLPLILFLIAAVFFAGVFVLVKAGRNNKEVEDEPTDEVVAEIPFANRPFTTLTPSADGHELNLKIENINVPNAASLDYELYYDVPDGRPPQGVNGNVELESGKTVEQALLLGSESSGKKRYDQGVEKGTLTLKFRSDKGKLVGKLMTDFHLQSATTDLSTVDGNFKLTLSKKPTKSFFITMNTFGVAEKVDSAVADGPIGVFQSDTVSYSGKVSMSGSKIYRLDGSSWEEVNKDTLVAPGIFVSTN